MTEVWTPLDRNNLLGRVTHLLDWSEERDVGRSGLDRVEGGGDTTATVTPGRDGPLTNLLLEDVQSQEFYPKVPK